MKANKELKMQLLLLGFTLIEHSTFACYRLDKYNIRVDDNQHGHTCKYEFRITSENNSYTPCESVNEVINYIQEHIATSSSGLSSS